MKIKLLIITLFVLIGFVSCKKDAMKVDAEKVYRQTNALATSDAILNTTVYLELKPKGVADILPGGDIMYRSTYKINGKKLTVKTQQGELTFKFTIVSEKELHGEHGEVLMLQE